MSFSQTRESGSEKVPSAPGYLVEKGIGVTRNGGGGDKIWKKQQHMFINFDYLNKKQHFQKKTQKLHIKSPPLPHHPSNPSIWKQILDPLLEADYIKALFQARQQTPRSRVTTTVNYKYPSML